MAEILCGVLSATAEPSVDGKEQSSRAARRQRMVMRRCRMASGEPREHPRTKRRGLPVGSSSGEVGVSYGTSSVCGRRREMEDAVSVRPDFVSGDRSLDFFGVFDGHGCSHVADSCRDRMYQVVAEEMEGLRGLDEEVEDWKGVMERSFARVDSEVVLRETDGERSAVCRCESRSGNSERVGSTAVVAVVSPESIVVGNCGDSRAVLLRGGAAVPLSSDHKPDRADELQRIQAAGGKVIYWDGARVLGVLAMSRSIGDNYLKPFVTSEPEVTITPRTDDDECLIVASDGLWDVVSNETACHMARTCLARGRSAVTSTAGALSGEVEGTGEGSDVACMGAAMLLTKLAIAKGSADNVTVVVVGLRRTRRKRSLDSSSSSD